MNHRARIPAVLLALALLLGQRVRLGEGRNGGCRGTWPDLRREQRRPDLSQPAGQRDARAGRNDPDGVLQERKEVTR